MDFHQKTGRWYLNCADVFQEKEEKPKVWKAKDQGSRRGECDQKVSESVKARCSHVDNSNHENYPKYNTSKNGGISQMPFEASVKDGSGNNPTQGRIMLTDHSREKHFHWCFLHAEAADIPANSEEFR